MHDERIHLFADSTLDLARGCLLSASEPVHLRPQAYEVLKHLAENKGRLVSKDSLIETVWRERAVTDDALVQCLMEVRHALGEKGKRYVDNLDLAFFGAPDEPCFQWSACHNSPFATGWK